MRITSLLPVASLLLAVAANAAIVPIESFDSRTVGQTLMLQHPGFSGSTSGFLDTTTGMPNTTNVSNTYAASGPNSLAAKFKFKDDTVINNWVRLTAYSTSTSAANLALPYNTVIDTSLAYAFKVLVMPLEPQGAVDPMGIALSIREMNVPADAPIGYNAKNYATPTGGIEFVGASGVSAGSAPVPTRWVNPGVWTELVFDMPNEPTKAFAGATANGILQPINGTKVVLDAICLRGTPGQAGAAPKQYAIYFDDFRQGGLNEVPEPATLSLLGLGLLPLIRRKK